MKEKIEKMLYDNRKKDVAAQENFKEDMSNWLVQIIGEHSMSGTLTVEATLKDGGNVELVAHSSSPKVDVETSMAYNGDVARLASFIKKIGFKENDGKFQIAFTSNPTHSFW